MSCLHLYDFVSGTRVTLAVPPCQTAGADEGGAEYLDIVRSSAEAREMVERHLSVLAAARVNDGEVGES
ncbi:MAG: hypothetical protein ACTSX7_14825 [Alphaproteobacteria bacterium]